MRFPARIPTLFPFFEFSAEPQLARKGRHCQRLQKQLMPIFAVRAWIRIAVRAHKRVTQVRRSHPSHEAPPCLAISKRSAAPFSLLFRPPVYFPPSSRQRNKGHVQRSLIFLAGRLPVWHLRKQKYAGDQTSPGATARGWSTVFTFLPVNLDGNAS